MEKKYYSNWNRVILAVVVSLIALFYGNARNWDEPAQIGLVLLVLCLLWTLSDHYTTYVKFKDGVLTNSGKKIFWPDHVKISSIRYVARMPQFVFRSWGGQVVIYFKDGKLVQTSFLERLYSVETIREILKEVIRLNPEVELDKQYHALVEEKDPNKFSNLLMHVTPRSVQEVE